MKDNRLFRILYYILENGKVTANELDISCHSIECFPNSADTTYLSFSIIKMCT